MAKTMCLYGSSGSCKTSALATFVTGMYRATGKKARLYNVDGGVASIQHLIDAGLVTHWELGNHPHPFEAVVDASRGYWPLDIKDPRSPWSHRHSHAGSQSALWTRPVPTTTTSLRPPLCHVQN